jgi:uncharacterized protein
VSIQPYGREVPPSGASVQHPINIVPAPQPINCADWPDVAGFAAAGWRPTPFRQYIMKIHSRCNLACDYCYVYAMADQGWRTRPTVMARQTIIQTSRRIAEAVMLHGLTEVSVVFHGGEPLLAGAELISFAAMELRRAMPSSVRVQLGLQTNGVLLDRENLQALLDHDIRVGVSLDGDSVSHDRHRRHRNGRGSHAEVVRAVSLLRHEPFRRLYTGILSTIDLAADPLATYDVLAGYEPPVIDFLLPHGNWSNRPPGRVSDPAQTPYADWLIPIFERWYGSPQPRTRIRLFAEIINLCLGGNSRLEAIGLSPVGVIVIETDGSLEQVDTLKSAFQGAAATGLNVFSHGFDAALAHPAVVARQIGAGALSPHCEACPLRRICGGGYYPHRYLDGSGYRNPSVYCPDLAKLITHIRLRLAADLDGMLAAL